MVTVLRRSVIVVRGRIAERVREEAVKLGVSVDEYLVELLSQNLDPRDRAKEYINAAEELLGETREELEKNNVRQAAEKLWGAAALAVKAYALWREGKRLSSHGELWEYKRVMEKELGKWVYGTWAIAQSMHVCFYEGWCVKEDIENALEEIEKLVREVASKINKS